MRLPKSKIYEDGQLDKIRLVMLGFSLYAVIVMIIANPFPFLLVFLTSWGVILTFMFTLI